METALRFGAGVTSDAALAPQAADFGSGLVRDANSVLRTGNLQPRTGGPGPEAFAQAQATLQRLVRSYETVPASAAIQSAGALDLLA
jgi:hypothetical protein